MRVVVFTAVIFLLLVSQAIAVQNPRLYVGEEQVTKVPATINPIERKVTLLFEASGPFNSGTLDASDMVLSGSLMNAQRNIAITECETLGGALICTVEDLSLETNKREVRLSFEFDMSGNKVTEEATITFDLDSSPPSIGKIELNNCTGECYFGTGQNRVTVEISDDTGISTDYLPIIVGAQTKRPYQCLDGKCYYDFASISCIDGSTVRLTIPTTISDVLGNRLTKSIVKEYICDPKAPELIDGPRVVERGPYSTFVEGVPILFKAIIKDSTPTVMEVDLTSMDGSKKSVNCVSRGANMEQICEGEIYSPPGPQKGFAEITLRDAAGNEVSHDIEIEVLALNTEATPVVTVDSLKHKGSISKMFLSVAAQRRDYTINYPISFELSPEIITSSGNLRARISFIDLKQCRGGFIKDSVLASTSDESNRIDFRIDPQWVMANSGNADFNCTLEVYVTNSKTFFETPGVVNIEGSIHIKGTSFDTPGVRVVKKIEEDSPSEVWGYVEAINNVVPTLNTLCSVSDAIDKGQQVGAAVTAVGFAIQTFDGGNTKKAGQTISEGLFKLSGALGSYGNDKNDKDLTEEQKAIRDATSPTKLIAGAAGLFREACSYITCEDAQGDQASLTDAESYKDLAGDAWDQLSAPNAGENLAYAISQKCVPAIVSNLNDIGQVKCGALMCTKQMAMSGLDLSSCEAIESEGMCKKVVGASTETLAYFASLSDNPALGTAGDVTLAMKNLQERFASVAINTVLSAGNKALINLVTDSCTTVEDESAFDDYKSFKCFFPYAIRLFIQSGEQSQFRKEISGAQSDLCKIAFCEGNDCINKIPTLKNPEMVDQFVLEDRTGYSAAQMSVARGENNQIIKYDFGDDPLKTMAKARFTGVYPPSTSVSNYVAIGTSDGQTTYVSKEYWDSLPDKGISQSAYRQIASGTYQPENAISYTYADQGVVTVYETPAYYDYYLTNAQSNEEGLKREIIRLPEGVDPNDLAPAAKLDESFKDKKLNYLMDARGKTYAYNSETGDFEQVWNPANPGLVYDLYSQVASRYINQWVEKKYVSHARNWINEQVPSFDLYSAFENAVCEAAVTTTKETGTIFEPTEQGYRQFAFNTERQLIDGNWYYTLIYFMSGFSDRDEGYQYQIVFQPGNDVVGRFHVYPGEIYRPDSRDLNFKSLRAFNTTKKYDEVCFRFSPGIPGGSDEYCKPLREGGFSGLGDPYVRGQSIGSGSRPNTNIQGDGWVI